MESNHRPFLAGTVFKTACAPCAPSSVVGAERIELPTSCSQSKRATGLRYAPKMGVGNTQRPGTRWNASWRMNALCCQHRSGPGLIPAIGRVRELDQCLSRVRHAVPGFPVWVPLAFCVSFNAAALMLAPATFPGCHVICRPATYHGIEPPPFLPSLDRRAGIEPALSLLVAGGDPGFARLVRCARTR